MPSDNQQATLVASPPPQMVAAPDSSHKEGAATLLSVISRAASDPNTDVDKMQRLLDMHRDLMATQSKEVAMQDFARFKEDCPQIGKARQGDRGKWNYAPYEHLMKQIRPHMVKAGLSERFETRSHEGVICEVTCTIVHRSGHEWSATFPVAPDPSGSKNSIQAIGSAMSYGKRYAIGLALGLVFTDEDDDAMAQAKAEEEAMPVTSPNARKSTGKSAVTANRADLLSEVGRRLIEDGITDMQLDAAMYALGPGAKTENGAWRELPDNVLAGILKPSGWKKVEVKIAEAITNGAAPDAEQDIKW